MEEYVKAHRELVEYLRKFGIYFDLSTRLDLFWLRNNSLMDAGAVALIDKLVKMRTEGLEPKHESGTYV